MNIGIGSYAYAWAVGVPGYAPAHPLSAAELVDRAAELGADVVQFCDNLPLHLLSDAQVNALCDQAKRGGVRLQAGARGSQPSHLLKYIGIAGRIGSPILRIVVDNAGDEPEPETVVIRLRKVLPELERAGICLAIENHDRFKAGTLAAIVRELNTPRVGICLDTVNSFGALEGPDAVLDALLPHTVNLHVKDFVIRRHSHNMGFEIEGCPAGEGRLDIPNLLRRLQRANPEADAILELWTPRSPDLAETIAREDAWVRQSMEYLKKIREKPA